MSVTSGDLQHRLYPIGCLPEKDVVNILTDAFCAEPVEIDQLMNEWRAKSKAFDSMPAPELEVLDSELLPLDVSEETMARIDSLLASYRIYLPSTFDLAFVPIQKLISSQISLIQEHAQRSLDGAQGPLSNDANALACLGTPLPRSQIEAAFLGSPQKGPQFFNALSYVYQFSSDDPNIRFIPLLPFKPLRDMNLASDGATFPYDVKAIPVAVGLGLPIVHVIKTPSRTDHTQEDGHRLIIANGLHRIFRLAELGNTHVAALIQTLGHDEIPNPFVDVTRDYLFSPRPLTIPTMMDPRITRLFRWKKSRRVIKLQLTVTQEISQIA